MASFRCVFPSEQVGQFPGCLQLTLYHYVCDTGLNEGSVLECTIKAQPNNGIKLTLKTPQNFDGHARLREAFSRQLIPVVIGSMIWSEA